MPSINSDTLYSELSGGFGQLVAKLTAKGTIEPTDIAECCPWRSVCPTSDHKHAKPYIPKKPIPYDQYALIVNMLTIQQELLHKNMIPKQVLKAKCHVREYCPHCLCESGP